MNDKPKDMAVSARARLANRARERKENAPLLMTRYVRAAAGGWTQ